MSERSRDWLEFPAGVGRRRSPSTQRSRVALASKLLYGRAMRASELLGPEGPLAQGIAGYEHRPSQLAMADAVQDALQHRGVLLAEAGTGTGKTWAYLVPALLSGRKVVVSTGTRNLQDQIMHHDVPAILRFVGPELRDALGATPRIACMKGLSNYLCRRRYQEFIKSASAGAGHFGRQLRVLEEWKSRTEHGERTEVEELDEDAAIWGYVSSSSETRIGARCSYFDSCFVTKMRREAEKAQLIVVNHHLFFADLAMRGPHGGSVIPDYDAVIFDEAHQIEDVATLFFGSSMTTGKLERLAGDVERALSARSGDTAEGLVHSVRQSAKNFFASLPTPKHGRRPLEPGELSGEIEQRFFALDDALDAVGAHLRSIRHESDTLLQLARRCGRQRDELARISDGQTARSVSWLAPRGKGVSIGISPVDVSDVLQSELFHKTDAVVLTSATLTTGGDFTFIKRRLGVDFEVDEMQFDSPFAYSAQAALYIPESLPDPRAPDFLEAAAREVLGLIDITGGGAFVLCTSFRMMHALADRCAGDLREAGCRVFVQGQAPKPALLSTFRKHTSGVLFATASFWEGVDVPGDQLRLVVIDKVPFDVPTDPLVRARCRLHEQSGGNAFMDLVVPTAALGLKQGFGRLIRSRRDRGIVAILDARIVRKRYGSVFLQSLPDASRCYSPRRSVRVLAGCRRRRDFCALDFNCAVWGVEHCAADRRCNDVVIATQLMPGAGAGIVCRSRIDLAGPGVERQHPGRRQQPAAERR